jgi:glutaredoxin
MTRSHYDGGSRPGAGPVLLMLGGIGLTLGLLQRSGAPVPYQLGEWLVVGLSLGMVIVGSSWLWRDDHPRTRWAPTRSGRRFNTAVLYTREGCHLCDDVHALLIAYGQYLPEIALVDIDADPDLHARFDTEVPVVELDGQERFRGRVSEVMLQRLIEGTPPVER